MGYYVNSKDGKEKWLRDHNVGVQHGTPRLPKDKDLALVVLVDNMAFTAAGIVFSQAELKAFTLPNDTRPKKTFYVPKKDLVEAGFIKMEAFEY